MIDATELVVNENETRKINVNFIVRNQFGEPMAREMKSSWREMLGKEAIADLFNVHKNREDSSQLYPGDAGSPKEVYDFVQRMMSAPHPFEVTENEYQTVLKVINYSQTTPFMKGQLLTLIENLELDERKKTNPIQKPTTGGGGANVQPFAPKKRK